MAKSRVQVAGASSFAGVDATTAESKITDSLAQVSINSDNDRPGLLQVRTGYARSSLSKLAYPPRAALWWVSRDGIDRLIYNTTAAGTLTGIALPTNDWGGEPVVRGGVATFNPVTNLAISDLGGITLTWTNPVSAYYAGTLVLRRTDRYSQSVSDPNATVLLNAKAATVTDTALAVGDTGFYSVFAYSRTRFSLQAQISGTKIQYGVWDGSTTGTYWKA